MNRSRPFLLGLFSLLSLSAVIGCGVPVSDIGGTAIDTYDPGGVTTTAPADTAKWTPIGAVVDDGELTSYPGEISADGTLRIADVPEGPYFLKLTYPPGDNGIPGYKAFYENTTHSLDLGKLYSHRQGLSAITKPTFLTLNAPLTIPWHARTTDDQGSVVQELHDTLALVSRSADVHSSFHANDDSDIATGAPKDGALALDGWAIDARIFFNGHGQDDLPHLISADKNDDFVVVHNVNEKVTSSTSQGPWSSYLLMSAKEVFRPASFTMTDGGSTTLTGSFEALPQKTFSLDYKASFWNALLSDIPHAHGGAPVDPSTDKPHAALNISVRGEHSAPSPASDGFLPLISISTIESRSEDGEWLGLPGDYAHDFSYGNPLSAGQELVSVTFTLWISVEVSNESVGLPVTFTVQAPAAELSGAPLKPVVSLPRNVKVNGKPAPVDYPTTHVGKTPEISFDAPALGSPDSYMVLIRDFGDVQTTDASPYTVVGAIYVSSTTTNVKVPEGLLQEGRRYLAQVFAVAAENADPAAPFRLSARYASAATLTGVFIP